MKSIISRGFVVIVPPLNAAFAKGGGSRRSTPVTSAAGLDSAKNVFQIRLSRPRRKAYHKKRLRRTQLGISLRIFRRATLVWQQRRDLIIGLLFCKPSGTLFVWLLHSSSSHTRKSQKNHPNDAAAIGDAVSPPQMRFVPTKTVEQQDPHRIRSRASVPDTHQQSDSRSACRVTALCSLGISFESEAMALHPCSARDYIRVVGVAYARLDPLKNAPPATLCLPLFRLLAE
jgi:hypothetical protein